MKMDERTTKVDRMRFTKDKFSANMVLLAIVLDILYFVRLYQVDVGTYFYNWVIGASIVYNLLFLLTAFLAEEGVKNRHSGYTSVLTVIGVLQFVRIFYLPAKAHKDVVVVANTSTMAMTDGHYVFSIVCLLASGICCLVAAAASYKNQKDLSAHLSSMETC
jgi:hypothetical protein